MSAISLLPLLKVSAGVQTDEDFTLAIAFYLSDGVSPINLTGISFTSRIGSIFSASTAAGTLSITGANSNNLVFAVPASAKASWPTGAYTLSLLATDGTYTRDVFAMSTLTVGAPALDTIAPLVAPGGAPTSVASLQSSSVATALSQNAEIFSAASVYTLSTSATITSPGVYAVTTTGVVLTLPSSWTQYGAITIKDFTGSSNPSIQIAGPIDGGSGLTLSIANEAVTFCWIGSLNTWISV